MKIHTTLTALAISGLVLTGCGGGSDTKQAQPAPKVTSSTLASAQADPDPAWGKQVQGFLAWAHSGVTFGKAGFQADKDDATLKRGQDMCNMFANEGIIDANDVTAVAKLMSQNSSAIGGPTVAEATALIHAAVNNLCPQYKAKMARPGF
jgi:hypothetical protein